MRKQLSIGQRVNWKDRPLKGTVVEGPFVVSHFREPVYLVQMDDEAVQRLVKESAIWGVWAR